MNRTVGTCGVCGGRVSVPAAWYATVPPVPVCEACGRQAARPWGPVVEMAPSWRVSAGIEAELAERIGEGRKRASAVDWTIDCPVVQKAEAREKLQAFLRRSQGQGGGEPGGEGGIRRPDRWGSDE